MLSSYVALDLILFARINPFWPRMVCLILALAGIFDAANLCWLSRATRAVPRRIEMVADAGGEVTGYLATYLLPLLAAPSPTAGDLVAYGIYAGVIVVVSLRSQLAHVNPTLYLLGRRVSSVTFENGGTDYVISRAQLRAGDSVRVTRLAGVLVSD